MDFVRIIAPATERPVTLRRRSFSAPLALAVCAMFAGFLLGDPTGALAAGKGPMPAIAMHGEPAFPDGRMPYVNADAPKGGRLVFGVLGTFDSLNPMIVRGIPLPQIRGYVVESLMARGHDEPFTLYGLLAESIETDDARSTVTFRIRPNARFSDGKPVTAEDVLFSKELLQAKGRPNHRLFYSKIVKATALDERTVRFDLGDAGDRELPLILGLMPILAKHATDVDTFEETSLTAPLGSGAYRVSHMRPGASITLERNPDYWGRDLPINRGLWNFDEVRFEFFRDANTSFEAFKRGLYDFRVEPEPLRWSTGYDVPAIRDGSLVKEELRNGQPQPSDFLVFNTRRPQFADVRVREALSLLLDFEWINRNYFFGQYRRSGSFFPGSRLSAYGGAANETERRLLKPFAGEIRDDILNGTYRLPTSDMSGRDRELLRRAIRLFTDAGYQLSSNVMRERVTGKPFEFEILTTTRDQERIALAFVRDLKRAGITATVRVVDAVQFDQRRIAFDFDMIQNRWDQSLSPGNEQAFYFGSEAADSQGSRNYMGVKSPAVDAMIRALLGMREQPDFEAAVRALDRSLMSGFYVIPVFNVPAQWVARWTRIARPEKNSLSGILPETWWHRPDAKSRQ